ncbi:hypothetical protein ACFLTS_06215 [Chloroflexota bacterium]
MIKRVILALVLLGSLIGINVGTALAKGPPPDTHGYEMYKEHAGDGTHADDPLDIIPNNPGPEGAGF